MCRQIECIISGGQTGVDRAALDWARKMNIKHGGWCPRGRLAEDGVIPSIYHLTETPSADYAERTEWNVKDSEATLIFSSAKTLVSGTALTKRLAVQYQKPTIHIFAGLGVEHSAGLLKVFVNQYSIKILNVAGPRESESPGIGAFVTQVLDASFL